MFLRVINLNQIGVAEDIGIHRSWAIFAIVSRFVV
jgi:hypothetical protein